MINLILLVFAFVLFFLASLQMNEPYHARLVAAGLACWVASEFVGKALGVK